MMLDPTMLIDRLPAVLQGRILVFRQHAARRSFAWNVSVMLFGTVTGQAFSLLLSPVLTRLYTPTQFGYLSVYGAVLTIFGVVASLGLELAIPICMDDDECADLLALNGLALLCTTALVALCAAMVSAETLDTMWLGSLASYRWLLPIGFACLGGYYIMVAVATRAGAFREIARTRISQGISGPVSQIVLGLLSVGTPGLVLGYVIGQSSGTLLLFSRVVVRHRQWLRHVTWRGIVAMARRYINFPLFASWSRVFDMAGGGMVLFVLFSACYSPEVAGFMFLSERVIARPLLIVSTSLLQVFTGEAGRAVSQDPVLLRRRFYQVVPRQFALSAVWILFANALAGWAFPLLFGTAWGEAVPYLRALSLSYLMIAVLHPVSTTLQMLEHQATAAIWQICRLVLVVAGVLVAWRAGLSAVDALWVSALVQAACCLALLLLMIGSIEQVVTRWREPRCTRGR
ncbi:MAG TPA: lipopolysaccharide biosynthesis protein [Rhodanobacter sp.]|nr:lipopolysaccharide biosynthesis protein [Rhodanobacter sp.]